MMLLESDSTRSLLPPSSRLIRYVMKRLASDGYTDAPRALLADLKGIRDGQWGRPTYCWTSLLTAEMQEMAGLPEVTTCGYCGDYVWVDRTEYISGWGDICEGCRERHLHCCGQCGEDFLEGEPSYHDGEPVCSGCWDNSTHCSQCDEMYFGSGAEDDGWYYSQFSRSWYCAGCAPACRNGQCEAEGQVFSIPAYGATTDDRLSNDTAITVEVAGGEIPIGATKAVRDMLVNRCRLYLDEYGSSNSWNETIGDRWQTKEGNWPKRFATYLLKNHNLKLAEPLLAEIGNLVRQEASRTTECVIDVTRDFNQTANRFCHSGSCYWGQYIKSRCALKSNGAFGLRMWNSIGEQKDDHYSASGRVWVQPVTWDGSGRDLIPTTDTDAKIYVLWNFYYSDSNPRLLLARILAQLTGKTYWQTTIGLPEHVYNNTVNNVIVAAPDVIDAMQQSRYSDDWTLQMEEAH